MPPHLLPGLTPEAATDICMNQCRAGCCRGPLVLSLEVSEIADFESQAARLGTKVHVALAPDGAGWVKFADYPGQRCPMLDQSTYACRIYENRPQRCREFPEKLTPGCAISGG